MTVTTTRSLNEVRKITLLLACIWALNFLIICIFIIQYQSHFHSCEFHSIPAHSRVLFLIFALSLHHAIISDISTSNFQYRFNLLYSSKWRSKFSGCYYSIECIYLINYLSWSRSTRRELDAKNKLSNFIDGTIPITNNLLDLNHCAWELCNH